VLLDGVERSESIRTEPASIMRDNPAAKSPPASKEVALAAQHLAAGHDLAVPPGIGEEAQGAWP
jgi:hypothetical protein